MAPKNWPFNYNSFDLEVEAIAKLRSLVKTIPRECKIFRELKDDFIFLTVDFEDCPQEVDLNIEQFAMCGIVCSQLGLANSVLFKIGNQIIGSTQISGIGFAKGL
ncbi:MAG: hypothetical protein QNJ54_14505 [Prochloraceae cyanobacterium]|nr:hypothetical protein [Prochloraceae cyanobacterium]